MSPCGTLYLIPVPISEESLSRSIPPYNTGIVCDLRNFIAEDPKIARRFLKQIGYPDISAASVGILNEHTASGELEQLLDPLLKGYDTGLMSDAGCPGIADP